MKKLFRDKFPIGFIDTDYYAVLKETEKELVVEFIDLKEKTFFHIDEKMDAFLKEKTDNLNLYTYKSIDEHLVETFEVFLNVNNKSIALCFAVANKQIQASFNTEYLLSAKEEEKVVFILSLMENFIKTKTKDRLRYLTYTFTFSKEIKKLLKK